MSASRIICYLTGKHTRSRKHAKISADGYLRSHCTRCGQPLIRTYGYDGRAWQVDRDGADVPASGGDAAEGRGSD